MDIRDTIESIVIIGIFIVCIMFCGLFVFGTYLYLEDIANHDDMNPKGVLLNKSNLTGNNELTFTWRESNGTYGTRTFKSTAPIYNGIVVGQEYDYHSRDGIVDNIGIPYDEGL